MNESKAAMWLGGCVPLSAREKRALYDHFGSAEGVYYADRDGLLSSGRINEKKLDRVMKDRECYDADAVSARLRDTGARYTHIGEPDYPEALTELCDAPFGLYYMGTLPKPGERIVAMVGARRCSAYGRDMARRKAKELAERGIAIASGLALGIDAAAHSGALAADGRTIAVLGCGIDICYPAANAGLYKSIRDRGCILSEYAPGTQPLAVFFPSRNRIISGLSHAVIVIEARKKSGSLITADLALEQGRDVWALPGRVGDALSEGTNGLIAAGAGIFTDTDSFLADIYAFEEAHRGQISLSDLSEFNLEKDEALVYSCLDLYPKDIDSLQRETGKPLSVLFSALSTLTARGMIRERFLNHYERTV